ncbi:CAAX prenyl protease-related protein [Bythopirellula polymerisocia]|uniref:CAAX amino terminal protease self-immunity n=1 Tax=Bythopirellula polymerisocia TaxID=2528003 RepID=A0A5C6D339_9BACT|nr:CAAX prenyl protease-related protein [Bythopirellula polymerisocia]TWU30067.1 CAAX amino terminal protease self- immunity [Bythopirellula polymerisocia]
MATDNPEPAKQVAAPLPPGWLSRWPAVTFLFPFAVFMLIGSLEPTPPKPISNNGLIEETSVENPLDQVLEAPEADEYSSNEVGLIPKIPYTYYPWVYSLKIALTAVAMVLVWPGYRTFPWQVTWLSVAVGVVGVVLWVLLCHLRLEPSIIGPLDRFLGGFIPGREPGDTPTIGLLGILGTGERSAFNPLEQMANQPAAAWAFLLVRFIGLALIVPVIEEFFLRGFLMRFVMHQQWWQVPFGEVDGTALLVGTLVPMMMHPGELLAAAVWFSMVTWLMLRTRNIWDCVVAHGVTNLLLGIYVVLFDQWQLM